MNITNSTVECIMEVEHVKYAFNFFFYASVSFRRRFDSNFTMEIQNGINLLLLFVF